MVPLINYSTAAAVLLLCCVMRDRVVRHFMRADVDFFSSGVLDVYFSGSMLFCLSFYIHQLYSRKMT